MAESEALDAALARAGESGEAVRVAPERTLFRLRLAGAAFACDPAPIHEVIAAPPLTSLPGAPPFLLGVCAHRGEILPVIDLARLLDLGPVRSGARARLAVARLDGMAVAIAADELPGLVAVPEAAVEPPPAAAAAPFVAGIVAGTESLTLLDLPAALLVARDRAGTRR